MKRCYPSATKDAATSKLAIRHFIGGRAIRVVYSDNAGELKAACRELEILHEFSQTGNPKTNGIAEWTNSDVLSLSHTHWLDMCRVAGLLLALCRTLHALQ